jgi:hypothetical protein
MANRIKRSKIVSSTYVDVTSRYNGSKVIYYGDNNILTFESYKRSRPSFGKTDKYYLITGATEFRPDLVSNSAYGVTSFWWRIMEANGIKDIMDFKAGTTIRIPESLF